MELTKLFSYLISFFLLFFMYKRVVTPFLKKMIESKEEDLKIEKNEFGVFFDEDEDSFEEKELLEKKIKSLRKKIGENQPTKESVEYDIILEKLKEMAEEKPKEITKVLSDLGGSQKD